MRFKLKQIAVAGLLACLGASAVATNYFYVMPKSAGMSVNSPISLSLNASSLPNAVVGSAYNSGLGFDLKSLLVVTGDAGYDSALVSFSITSGALPPGLNLSANGVLAGTPTTNGAGSQFQLTAQYKSASAIQTFQFVALSLSASSLTFAPTAVGLATVGQAISLTNASSVAVTIGTPSAAKSYTVLTNGCSTSLAAGATCSVTVAYAPTLIGTQNDTLTIPTGAGAYNVALTGVGNLQIASLIVAGGGAGGSHAANDKGGGGGGAGGLLASTATLLAAMPYPITVGFGGVPTVAGANSPGGNGEASTFAGLTAVGGGGGGQGYAFGPFAGQNGGSGGGGVANNVGGGAPGTGVSGQGFTAGTNTSGNNSAGGGGAGGAGSGNTANTGGAGGPGFSSSITGVTAFYAGGGGGGAYSGTAGVGGSGIGGAAGSAGLPGSSGAANTGSGGGGAGPGSAASVGGAGGTGVVIVRVPLAYAGTVVTTGTPTTTVSGGFKAYRFASNGSIQF